MNFIVKMAWERLLALFILVEAVALKTENIIIKINFQHILHICPGAGGMFFWIFVLNRVSILSFSVLIRVSSFVLNRVSFLGR